MIHQHLGGMEGGGSAKTGEMFFKFLPNVEMRRSLTVNHQMSSKAKGREYQSHMYPNLHHAPYEDIISLEEATNIVTD